MKLSSFFTASYALMILYYTERKDKDALAFLKSAESKELAANSEIYSSTITAASQSDEAFDEALQELGAEVKRVQETMARNGSVTARSLDQLRTFGAWMRTGSESALKKLGTLSAGHAMPWIPAFFAKEVGSQHSHIKDLERLVNKHFGEKRATMNVEEGVALKEKNPEDYKEYLRLRKEFNQTWKDAVSTYVRKSGQTSVPMKEVMQFLKEKNLQTNWPTGFTGNVGADGSWFTKDGKKITGIPAATLFPSVKMMNEDGNGAVFVAINKEGGNGNYFYTTEYKKEANSAKFAAVGELMKKIGPMRKRWSQLILNFDPADPKNIGALILELSYAFASRIGSPTNTSSQGLSTIRLRNVKIMPNGAIRIRYKGKDQVPTQHDILPPSQGTVLERAVAKAFKALLSDDKEGADYVFSVMMKNGRYKVIQPTYVNALFKAFGAPQGATVHKLRTLRGTRFMQDELNELYQTKQRFNDVKTFEATIEKLAIAVGKQLNHVRRTKDGGSSATGSTALANYIDPTIILQAYEHYGIPIPRWLEKITTAALANVTED